MVLAFESESGDVAWRQAAGEAVRHEAHQLPNGTYAVGSAVTDGGVESFVAALDGRTGEERWRSNRDGIAGDQPGCHTP